MGLLFGLQSAGARQVADDVALDAFAGALLDESLFLCAVKRVDPLAKRIRSSHAQLMDLGEHVSPLSWV
jgi:hypothetical protein